MSRTYHPRMVLVDGFRVREHPLYITWANMMSRCHNPAASSYANYGGRGIQVCGRWHHFSNFAADMGAKPDPLLTLERINNDIGYQLSNCRWATRTEQCWNRRVFANNTSGARGVVQIKDRFEARLDYEGERFRVGRYDTVEQAECARNDFIDMFFEDRTAAIQAISGETLWHTSSTKVRGVTKHSDGFIARFTHGGVRHYVGLFATVEEANAALEEAKKARQ